MMPVIIGENLYDATTLRLQRRGLKLKVVRASNARKSCRLDWYLPPKIYAVWREYATVRPSVIRVNYGIQRSEYGGMAMRAVTMLPCLIGSWKKLAADCNCRSALVWLNRRAEMPS